MTSDITTHRGFGIVLDPVQFAAQLASLKQRPQYQGRALYVRLPDAVAKLFESPLVPIRHSLAISGGAALPVAALTLQAAGTQIVCLVPLATDEARDWLVESVEKQRLIYVAVTIEEREQLVVMHAETPVRDFGGSEWCAVKERLAGWRSTDSVAEVADVLEVLRFVEQDVGSAVTGFSVRERWIFVCVPHDEHAGGKPSGTAQARTRAAAAVH